jgi:hypothetical protein
MLFADMYTRSINTDIFSRRTEKRSEKCAVPLLFKTQRRKMVKTVATLRCKALLQMVPAISPVFSKGQTKLLMGQWETVCTGAYGHVSRVWGLLWI